MLLFKHYLSFLSRLNLRIEHPSDDICRVDVFFQYRIMEYIKSINQRIYSHGCGKELSDISEH